MYRSPYANNIHNMSNSEVVSLAKNRFTDDETQLAIAKHWYKLGRRYLAANPEITQEAAKVLWDQRGYVLKTKLMASGTYEASPEEQRDIYHKYFKGKPKRRYRLFQAFLGAYSYWLSGGKNNTPSELIQEIYDDFESSLDSEPHSVYDLRRFISHENCPLGVALKIGTMKTPEINAQWYSAQYEKLRNEAMLKVAEITKRENSISR